MKTVKIGNIVTIMKGRKHFLADAPDANSKRVIQIDDLRNDKSIKYTNDRNGVFATEEDVLLVWDGANAGTVGYGKKGFIGSTIALLRKKQPDNYDTGFIGTFLQGKNNYLRSKTTGATIPHISRTALESLRIPLIDIDDQIRITTVLSKAEALIAQRKESLHLLDELLKSTFLEMFGELLMGEKQKIKLADVASVVSGLTKGKNNIGKMTSNVPYMRVANVQDGYLDLREIKEIEATIEEIARYQLEEGDLLLTEGGDPDKLGRGAVWKNEINDCIYQNHIFRVRADKKRINSVFLGFLTGSSYGKKYFLKAAKQTTGIASINSTQLKNFPVIVPPLELQSQFAQIVEKVEALNAHYQASLKELENLYGSLSQRAFKGELDLSRVNVQLPAEISEVEREKKAEEKVVTQVNKDLEDFHRSLPHSGAPADIDNKIRQLDTELNIRGEVQFWDEYAKYRILKGKLKGRFSYIQLRDALLAFPFDKKLTAKEIQEFGLSLLEEQPPFIEQIFDIPPAIQDEAVKEQEKQIMFRVIYEN